MKHLIVCAMFSISVFAGILQDAIDGADEYDILELPKGVYEGNIVIDKPLTIISPNKDAVIKGEGKGSVITIRSSYVTIQGLTIQKSGKSKVDYDSAILVKNAKQIEVSDTTIQDTFNGISFMEVSDSIIKNNRVMGPGGSVVNRGDGILVYGGQNNLIEENHLTGIRDLILDYSYNNKVLNNKIEDARYAMHGMNASGNYYEGNYIIDAIAGLYFMYNIKYTAKNNTVINSKGTKGIGLGLIECSDFVIDGNHFIYNTVGIMLDGSPDKYESKNIISNNNIAFCSEGIRFKEIMINSATPRGKNHFLGNSIYSNITTVVDESNGKELASDCIWRGNYWDSYKGYDEDKNGVGDIPYELFYYTDVVWMNEPKAKFFFNSIAMSLMDFLGRLAPTRDPYLVLIDESPKMDKGETNVN